MKSPQLLLGDYSIDAVYRHLYHRCPNSAVYVCPSASLEDVTKQEWSPETKIVCISNIQDIYDPTHPYQKEWVNNPFEEKTIDSEAHQKELYISSQFKDFHIIRVPGDLFGIEEGACHVHGAYDLTDLWEDIQRILVSEVRVINLVPPNKGGYITRYGWFLFAHKGGDDTFYCSTEYQEERVAEYERLLKGVQMFADRLCISNIAWSAEYEPHVLAFLQSTRICMNLELSLTKIAPWRQINIHTIKQLGVYLKNKGFNVHSVQSLFYDKYDLNIFKNQSEFTQHLLKVVDYACTLGAKRIIFGSSSTRSITCGTYHVATTYTEAHFVFINMFTALSNYLNTKDPSVIFCIKPKDCRYICTNQEAQVITNAINMKNNIAICVDTTVDAQIPDGFDISEVQHVHCSEALPPFLYSLPEGTKISLQLPEQNDLNSFYKKIMRQLSEAQL